MTRITIAQVNAEIEKLGGKERLVNGRFCYYFADGDAHQWPETTVPVFRLNYWSLQEWVEEYKRLKNQFESR
jgi:hypothetical protein